MSGSLAAQFNDEFAVDKNQYDGEQSSLFLSNKRQIADITIAVQNPDASLAAQSSLNVTEDMHCFLKTKLGKFKKHAMFVKDAILHFFRVGTDGKLRKRSQLYHLNPCHLRLAKPQIVKDVSKVESVAYQCYFPV